jgi:hypothetical protein
MNGNNNYIRYVCMYVWLVMMIDGCVLVLLIYAFYQVKLSMLAFTQ